MNNKQFVYLIVSFLFLFSSCIKDGENITGEIINYVKVGDQVPAFVATDLDGNQFDSMDFMGKQSVLLLFTTTCPDCQKILPYINGLWEEMGNSDDFQVIAISRGERAEVITTHWEKDGLTMPAYLDPGRDIFSKFADSTVPRVYVIDEKGIIQWLGIEKIDLEQLERIIK